MLAEPALAPEPGGPRSGPLAWLRRGLEVVVAAITAVMAAAIFAQVVLRYVFDAPLAWAEESAVLLFAWLIFLGAALVQASDSHLSIDMLRAVAGPRLALALDLLRLAVVAGCSAVLIYQGARLTQRTWVLLYPAMEVSRGLLYLSVVVGAACGLAFVAGLVATRLREPPGPPPTGHEA